MQKRSRAVTILTRVVLADHELSRHSRQRDSPVFKSLSRPTYFYLIFQFHQLPYCLKMHLSQSLNTL